MDINIDIWQTAFSHVIVSIVPMDNCSSGRRRFRLYPRHHLSILDKAFPRNIPLFSNFPMEIDCRLDFPDRHHRPLDSNEIWAGGCIGNIQYGDHFNRLVHPMYDASNRPALV